MAISELSVKKKKKLQRGSYKVFNTSPLIHFVLILVKHKINYSKIKKIKTEYGQNMFT